MSERVNIEIDSSIFSGRTSDERRARRYADHLKAGGSWRDLSGAKRLKHDRDIVSIPVGRRFRLTLDTRTGEGAVQTHENYSRTKPS